MSKNVDDKLAELAIDWKLAELSLKVAKERCERAKAEFEEAMLSEYSDAKRKVFSLDAFGGSKNGGTLTATKVERTAIEWFPEKLEKRLEPKVAKSVIKKKYTIPDLPSLATYLKSCGVNPKVFASYLNVEKEVNVQALEQLSDVGKIETRNVAGCYIVKTNKPYYKLTFKEDKDGETEESNE